MPKKNKIIIKTLSTQSMYFYTIYKKKSKVNKKKHTKTKKYDPIKNCHTEFKEIKI